MSEELQDQEVVEDFDIESEIESFESEWNESDETTEEDVSTEEDSEVEESQQESETEPEADEQGDDEEQENLNNEPQPSDEEQKRNAAFANLRRQAQENEKYAKFVQQLAEQSGVKPEEVLNRFEQRQLEQQAQQQNVPVDVIKRINELESYKQQSEYQQSAETFNKSVESTVEKYGIPQEELQSTFQQMAQNGIDFRQPGFDFEAQYLRFNKDNVVQREIERSRQKELAEKKERQKASAIPSGNSVSQSDEITDDFVDKMLKEFDISID